jgi:excinuclease ABC subunit A
VRFQVNDDIYSVADEQIKNISEDDKVYIIVDRLVKKNDDMFFVRITDSIRIAIEKGGGNISLYMLSDSDKNQIHHFSIHARCPICNYHVEELNLSNFSFNSHHGACETCHGL